jgi:hypothetical protein
MVYSFQALFVNEFPMSEANPSIDALRLAVQLACRPQNAGRIVAGRQQVLAMPRTWVIEYLERVAAASLNLSDYWEYRRLLELADLLDQELVQRLVLLGLDSTNADVREAAEDYRAAPN